MHTPDTQPSTQQSAQPSPDARDYVYQQRVEVRFEYPVYFTDNAFAEDNLVLRKTLSAREPHRCHRVWVAVDQGVFDAFPDLPAQLERYGSAHAASISFVAEPFVVPGGEASKNDPELISKMQQELARHGIDRHSFVLAIGGGAVLDAVGFAASTTHRGIRMVRMPSTVLAQNDAGVGVKDSVNRFGSKNFLGTFTPPFAVINDSAWLAGLTARDLRAGMAEAVKVALIRDASLFSWLLENAQALRSFESAAMSTMIRRAATIHLRHIAEAGDPFERGSARPLDFGHWAAHKLESLTQHGLRHGEAVAIGMALDTRYSELLGLITSQEREVILSLLETLGFKLWHSAMLSSDEAGVSKLIAGLSEFREHMGGELNIPMLAGLGRVHEARSMDLSKVADAIAFLRARDTARCD